jgi:hypothetical protein
MADKNTQTENTQGTPDLQAELDALKKQNEELQMKLQNTAQTEANTEAGKDVSVSDYLNERVTFRAFKDDNKYKDDIAVIVNGYPWQIQRGVTVQIPRYVLHAIENSERQKAEAANHSESLANEYRVREKNFA